MENEFYSSAGIPPPLHFESSTLLPTWQALSAAMEIQAASELNCSSNLSPDCFYNPNIDHNINFDSALSSMVSSPLASNSNITHENFVIRELIEKLGNIGSSGEISPHSQPLLVNSQTAPGTIASASYINGGNSGRNTSCYNTPLNSPPKLNLSMMDQLVKEKKISSLPLNSTVGEFSADPGFIERAAKFSCFGSRSFNGRTSQLGLNSSELPKNRSNPLMCSGKLPRVSSSPSLKALGSQMGLQENRTITGLANSQEESTLYEQNPIGDSNLKPTNEINSRKRKAVSKGKSKETPVSSPSANGTPKVAETNELTNAKRCQPNERNGNKNEKEANNKGRTSSTGDDKTSPNPPEPLKDYIHVRARRGQATDSHSLAERVRREKISERMKLLQDLVPNCNKVTGNALMLDEIINYVQSLQRQVEFLSMKLSSVNTRLDFNMDTLMSKEMFQTNNTLPQQIFPLDSSAQAIYGHPTQQNPQLHSSISNGPVNHFSVDPLDSALSHLPPLNGFSESISQYPTFGEDDLQTLVQMGFGQNPNRESTFQSQNFQGLDQKSNMKIEL